MTLDRVTFTGADDTVSPEEVIEMAEKYPESEWGILMGAGADGGSRFPSVKWIENLLKVTNSKVNLCAHLCGGPVMKLFQKGALPDYVTDAFQRIQVNTHGHAIIQYAEGLTVDEIYQNLVKTGRHFIFQVDGENDDTVREWAKTGIGDPLFDTSSGAGITPQGFGASWPKIWDGIYCGYAGGLGPLNVVYQMGLIKEAVGEGRIWVDMETKVRTGGTFSMSRCEDVLKKLKSFTTPEEKLFP